MNKLEQLTASREICNSLVELGIEEIAVLWHHRRAINPDELGEWRVGYLTDPEPFIELCIPAWTKAELDAMIGANRPKPDLFTDRELGLTVAETEDTPYKFNKDQYPIFMPDMVKIFTSGAEASAFVLIKLLEAGKLKPEDCIKRYKNIFKP
jgi:hypothetical protein